MKKAMSILVVSTAVAMVTGCAKTQHIAGIPCGVPSIPVSHRPGVPPSIPNRQGTVNSCLGGRVDFTISPSMMPGDVSTMVKSGQATACSTNNWLTSSTADGATMMIKVPRRLPADLPLTCGYRITVKGVGTIDPRIIIK